jgi:hypothetical protein
MISAHFLEQWTSMEVEKARIPRSSQAPDSPFSKTVY